MTPAQGMFTGAQNYKNWGPQVFEFCKIMKNAQKNIMLKPQPFFVFVLVVQREDAHKWSHS